LGDLLNMAVVSGDPQATADLARKCLADGHKYFRIGPVPRGELFEPRKSLRLLVAQLRAVRDAVGDQLELMCDIHTRFDPEDAVWFCNEVEPLGMFVVETRSAASTSPATGASAGTRASRWPPASSGRTSGSSASRSRRNSSTTCGRTFASAAG
jgi:galactonate dehydratase